MSKGGPSKQQQSNDSDMIDKDISFDSRTMHKTWPMVKGCVLLALAVGAFIFISIYVFKNFF